MAGIRMLDLSNVLAGPFCSYNLSRLGAQVIKIENPAGGDLARRLGADAEMAKMGGSVVCRRQPMPREFPYLYEGLPPREVPTR